MTASNTNNKAKHKVKSWYSNRYQIILVQRNILMLFTMVSMFSVAVAVIFVKTIMSSKSLEPYVIEVEEKTGIPTVVDQGEDAKRLTSIESVRNYFINKYVHAAMGYNQDTYKEDSAVVRLSSTVAVYNDFRRRINAANLASTKIDVRIKTTQFSYNKDDEPRIAANRLVGSGSAQVRIAQVTSTQNEEKNILIDMSFYFMPENTLSNEDRLINPLGFQVSKFKITEENYKYE